MSCSRGVTGILLTVLASAGCSSEPSAVPAAGTTANSAIVNVWVSPGRDMFSRTQQFTATAELADGSTKDVSTTATWKSSDPAVATVDTKGFVTGRKSGATNITAEAGGKTGVAEVTIVLHKFAEYYDVVCTPTKVPVGTKAKCTANAVRGDATFTDATNMVTWTSSDATIAKISDTEPTKGEVLANKVGVSKITMTPPDVALKVVVDLEVVP